MTDWKEVFLVDYYSISSGLSKSADQFGSGYPFVSFKDVFWNYFLPDKLTALVNTSKKERVTCSVKKGDVFLTRTSETIEELGMSCVALKDYHNATFNGFTKRLRPNNDNEIDPIFIGFYLRSPQFRAELTAYSTLTTRASLNNSIIGRLKINLPPLKTQRKIASILSAYDDLIENNLKRIKLLESQAEKTYEEWFVRLKFPGYEKTQINKIDKLPHGWKKVKASNLFSIQGGTQPPKSQWSESKLKGYVRMVQIRDYYTDSHIAYVKDKPSLRRCSREDIMIARYGASVGRICYGIDGVYNVALVKVLPFDKKFLELLRWYLKSDHFQLNLLNKTQRTAQDGFNKGTFDSLTLLKPSDEIINKFNLFAIPLSKLIANLKDQNQRLKEARDILLPRLMSGMINVDGLEVDGGLGMVAEQSIKYEIKKG